ncbi:MBL fold metallo-hydrolase [Fusibacter sp. JL216-2]|uniref:MBL fold metallo-hydrolase n=1 Tax=Fusibacter sp. JL216-2 TaxID=3071453 RepID=UPI003D33AA3F
MSMNFCSLASGSSGNCQYVSSETTHLLVDAGLSGKYIRNALENIDVDPEVIHGILISHEHSDHVKGVGVLMRRYGVKLYVNELTWKAMKHRVGEVDDNNIVFFKTNEKFMIGDIEVKPFSISHDAADPVGFSFCIETAKVCVATDLGIASDDILSEIGDCDLLMIEANHDEEMLKMGKYPYYLKRRILGEDGHISNEYAGGLVVEAARRGRVNQVLLGHLSKENNFPELAYETVRQVVEDNNIEVGIDLNIDMTYRDRVSRLYKIKRILD